MDDTVNRAEMFYCCASGAQKVAELDDALALVRREVEAAHRRIDAQDDEIARLRAERDEARAEVQRMAEDAAGEGI